MSDNRPFIASVLLLTGSPLIGKSPSVSQGKIKRDSVKSEEDGECRS